MAARAAWCLEVVFHGSLGHALLMNKRVDPSPLCHHVPCVAYLRACFLSLYLYLSFHDARGSVVASHSQKAQVYTCSNN